MANIPISSLPEAQSVASTDYLAIDNGTDSKKIRVDKFNEEATGSAYQYMQRAETAATNAAASAADALVSKNETSNLITGAQTLVSDAQTYAADAQTSANAASGSATTASNKATQATNSAEQARTYAENVNSYATEAKSWARGGTGSRVGEETDNAMYYANEAHSSELNAASSEANASTSEANAAASETNAASSETNAANSAGAAAVSESNAATSATNAASSETNAAASDSAAALSKAAAALSEAAAATSKEDAEAWSVGTRNGVPVSSSDPTYQNNAKYWAEVAAGAAGGGVTSFNGRSGIVTSAQHDYSAGQVDFDNSNNNFVATNTQAAIEEVQDNVDNVATDLTTLDNSLKPVAKSGVYNDLTGLPTLGTAAAKNSTNAVSPRSTGLVESGAVYDIADGLNNAILGNATAIAKAYKDDDTADTAIDDADYIPFYDTSAQTKKKILKPNLVGKTLTAQTLAIGATTLTFTDSSIGNNSRIRVISNPFTSGLLNAVQNGNTVTLTYDEQEVALSVTLEVRN